MHIGMILGDSRPYPPDIRVDKEIRALCQAGHRVTVLAQRIPVDAATFEELEADCAFVSRRSISRPSLLMGQWMKLTLVHPGWVAAIKQFIHEQAPDILHVHDFTLVPTTLKAVEKVNVPVVADLHENMPAALRAARAADPPIRKLRGALGRNYHLWRWHEKQSLPKCERVIVVVPEAAERLYEYGLVPDKIVVVSNTEDETTFKANPKQVDPEIVDRYQSDWVVSYVGGIGPHRGIDTVLEGVPQICHTINNFRLIVVGATKHNKAYLQQLVTQLGIGYCVDIIGWQPFEKVNSYIFASKACLVPHNDFEHTQTTVPHKLFQYMICARPVVVSNCRPLARIVTETQAGVIFEANSSEDFADKLRQLHDNPEAAQAMAHNGRKAALGPYAWRHDAAKLVQMYRQLGVELGV